MVRTFHTRLIIELAGERADLSGLDLFACKVAPFELFDGHSGRYESFNCQISVFGLPDLNNFSYKYSVF